MIIRIEEALERFRRGEFLIVVDDEDRENEGDFIIASENSWKLMSTLFCRSARCRPLM